MSARPVAVVGGGAWAEQVVRALQAEGFREVIRVDPAGGGIEGIGFGLLARTGVLLSSVESDLDRLLVACIGAKLDVPVCDGSAGSVAWYAGRESACYACGLDEEKRRNLLILADSPGPVCRAAREISGSGRPDPAASASMAALQVRMVADPKIRGPCRPRSDGCPLHVIEPHLLEATGDCVRDLLDAASALAPGEPVLIPDWPVVVEAQCFECRRKWHPLRPAAWVRRRGACPACGSKQVRILGSLTRLARDGPWAAAAYAELGFPPDHLYTVRFEPARAPGCVEEAWERLNRLAADNPEVLEVAGRRALADGHRFEIVLHRTEGIVGWRSGEPVIERSHRVVFRFPRFFPAVPLEVFLSPPVFHPNVDPTSGWVCVWPEGRRGEAIDEAVVRVQRMVAWAAVQAGPEALLAPEAERWARECGAAVPLGYHPVGIR